MTGQEPLDGFIDKWRSRWPEWIIAEAFVPQSQRLPVAAWFALLQELQDAAWAGVEPAPGLAKLAWWQEELRGWSRGARRHPLGQTLQRMEAGWEALGLALATLPPTRDPGHADSGPAALQTFAAAVLSCEAELFGAPDGAPAPAAVAAFSEALCIERALARGDLEAALDLRAALDAAAAAALARPRRLRQAILCERLRGMAAGTRPVGAGWQPVPPLRMLWLGWRAARSGNATLRRHRASGR